MRTNVRSLALALLFVALACALGGAPARAADPPLVTVSPSATRIALGDQIIVSVRVADPTDGCSHPIMDVTLSQDPASPALLHFDTPAKLGPPGPREAEYRLTAVQTGTLTLRAVAFGESDCNGWQWEYRSGSSPTITIVASPALLLEPRLYLPLV
jgi:hypothetical protein